MIRKFSVLFGAAIIVVFFVSLIALMGALRPEVKQQVAPSVAPIAFVETVSYGPMRLKVRTQGEVAPRREIQLTAQIGGRIDSVAPSFANGGVFQEGDVLLSIEDADYRLAVTRARANVAQSEQRLAIEEAESALAARDYEELSGDGATGEASLLTLRQPQLASAQADLAAARADLEDAQLALRRTQIIAPFDGRVRSIGADVGQFVNPGTALGQIFSTDVAEVRLPLTDDDLAKLQLPFAFEANDDAEAPDVRLYAFVAGQERAWQGRITRIDAAIDARTRQIAAIAEVNDPYGEGSDRGFPMAFGLFVNAEISGPEIDNAAVIPYISLQSDGTVFIVDEDDHLATRSPTIVAQSGEGYIAIGGLEPGERLVISPVTSEAGDPIRPLYSDGSSASLLADEPSGEEEQADASAPSLQVGANL
ncbi:MAG: efflux RND transporter periplasmic adaptor subunit [Pseudomonadota bacterium]